MYRSKNPEPVLTTTKASRPWGAGVPCYGFSVSFQCVVASCYTRYNVALRNLPLFSTGYRSLLQNRLSRAYMQVRACVRVYTRVFPCYIATNEKKSYKLLKTNNKNVAGFFSSGVARCSTAENNKILGIYSAGRNGAGESAANGRGLACAGVVGRASDQSERGRDGMSGRSGKDFKKWLISAIFAGCENRALDAVSLDAGAKPWFSAVFGQVGTFFLRKSPMPFTGGGYPPKMSGRDTDISGFRFFSIFKSVFLLLAAKRGRLFFRSTSRGMGKTAFSWGK